MENTQSVDFFEIWNRNKAQYTENPCVKPATSDALLPFIAAVHDHHENRLEGLQLKTAACNDRITGLEKQMQHLQDSMKQINDSNVMLKALAAELGMIKPIEMLMEKNERRLKNIMEKKIPACQEKINAQKSKLGKLEHKTEVAQAKADRCKALSDVIRSFVVLNPAERREKFAHAMEALHDASKRITGFKIAKCETKLKNLTNQHETAVTSVERVKLAEQIAKTQTELSDLITSLKRLEQVTIPYTEQPKEKLDEMAAKTAALLDTAVQYHTFTVAELSQDVCFYNAEIAMENKQQENQEQKKTENTKNEAVSVSPQSGNASYKMQVNEQQFAVLAQSGLPVQVAKKDGAIVKKDGAIVIKFDESIKDQVKSIVNQAVQQKSAVKK